MKRSRFEVGDEVEKIEAGVNGILPEKRCRTCFHCFAMHEYDSGPRWYCLFGAEHPRVRCGSVAMGEATTWLDDEYHLGLASDQYYEHREVDCCGICDEYRKKEEFHE
jgi:hypothetical protein